MKDINEHSFDGTSIYINSTLVSAKTGRIILIILNVLAWVGFGLLMSVVPKDDISSFIFPIIAIPLILIFGFGRFLAWNFWGKEYIRVSINSVTFSRSYGVVNMSEKTIPFKKFNFGYEVQKTYDGVKYGKLFFYDYGEDDNPKVVFENSILISDSIAQEICNTLEQLVLQRDFKGDELDFERINLN